MVQLGEFNPTSFRFMSLFAAVRTNKLAFLSGMEFRTNSALDVLVLLLVLHQHDLLVSHCVLPSNEVTLLRLDVSRHLL